MERGLAVRLRPGSGLTGSVEQVQLPPTPPRAVFWEGETVVRKQSRNQELTEGFFFFFI